MKNRFTIPIPLVCIIIVGATLCAGCGRGVSFTTASLSEATMCLAVDSQSKPVNPTTEFAPNSPEIFCSVKLSNAPGDTEVRSEWIYVRGELDGVTDYTIDTLTISSEGTRYVEFSLGIPDNGWPVGEYMLMLYIDGKEKESLPFTVEGAPISVTNPTMAQGVDSENRPVNPTSSFAPDSQAIYCSVYLANLPPDTFSRSEWYYLHGSGLNLTNHLFSSHETTFPAGSGYEWFRLNQPESGLFPRGEYAFILYLEGSQVLYMTFSVS